VTALPAPPAGRAAGAGPRGSEPASAAGDWNGCEVEIGCGNGHFLAAYAAGRPGTRLIGIDIKARRCRKAREKAEKRGLGNVTVVHAAAESFLRELVPASIDAFHIYFPDPWPKSRHRKRRFFTMESLRWMHAGLRPGGRLFFGTDFFDYYIQAKVLVALHEGFRITGDPAPQAVLASLYGRRFADAQKAIHLFSAVRVDSPDEKGETDEQERRVDHDVQGDEQP
jgi:tRNA (guanine-N7-)-methyltransferase